MTKTPTIPTTASRHRVQRAVTSVWIFAPTLERLKAAKERTGKSLYRLADELINQALDSRRDLGGN